MTVLTNRLNTESGCQLAREGGAMTDSEKEHYGASQMVRYVSGINRPIYPIAFIKYKTAIGISAAVCCFSPTGRKRYTIIWRWIRPCLHICGRIRHKDTVWNMLIAGSPCCQLKRQVFRQRRVVSESGQHRVSHESSKGARWSRAIQQSGAAPQAVSSFADRPRHCRSQEHVQATDCNKKQLTKINSLRTAAKLVAI